MPPLRRQEWSHAEYARRMSDEPSEHVVWGSLTEFPIELAGGQIVTIWATSYHVQERDYVFSVLMRGSPGYDVDIARIPADAVARHVGMRPAGPEGTPAGGDSGR
jgi:hypothetical protein